MSNFRKELEKIRDELIGRPINHKKDCRCVQCGFIAQISELVKGVIGEDDPEARVFEDYTCNHAFIENQLRHEQLAKLEEGK